MSARGAIMLAAAIVIAVERLVPHGRLMLYPFVLFATWVHEMGHGLSALLLGGRFDRLDVFADASGMAHIRVTAGNATALSAAAGLLAPPLVGALALALGRGPRRARAVLATLSLAMVVSVALWVRGGVGLASVLGVALVLGAAARWSSERGAVVWAQLLGLLLGLDAARRIDYLFTATATIGGRPQASDVSAIAAEWGGSHALWGALITGVGAALFGLGLWRAWRDEPRRP